MIFVLPYQTVFQPFHILIFLLQWLEQMHVPAVPYLGGIRYCFHLCMFRLSQSELLRAKTLQGFRIEKHSKRWNCFQRYIKPVVGTLRGLRSLLLSVLRKGKLRCCNLLMAMQGASSKAQTRTCFLISVSFASNPPSPQPKGDTNIQCWDIGCC